MVVLFGLSFRLILSLVRVRFWFWTSRFRGCFFLSFRRYPLGVVFLDEILAIASKKLRTSALSYRIRYLKRPFFTTLKPNKYSIREKTHGGRARYLTWEVANGTPFKKKLRRGHSLILYPIERAHVLLDTCCFWRSDWRSASFSYPIVGSR